MTMTGYYSIGLYGYEIHGFAYGTDDKIIWKIAGPEIKQTLHATKIYYSADGRPFFRPNAYQRVYLDECMRGGNI